MGHGGGEWITVPVTPPKKELPPEQWIIHVKDFWPWSRAEIRFILLYSLGSWNHRNLQKVICFGPDLQRKPLTDVKLQYFKMVTDSDIWVLQKINLCLVLICYWFRKNYFLWASKFVFVISKSLSYLAPARPSSLQNSQRISSPVETDFNSGDLLRTLEC